MSNARKASILVVEDQPEVRSALCRTLVDKGYLAKGVASKREAVQELRAGGFDLVTLDLCLGSENAIDLIPLLRNESNIPVIVITAKGDEVDRLAGLEFGADDYIAKPFVIHEVLLRIRNVLHRYGFSGEEDRRLKTELEADSQYQFDHCCISSTTRELTTTSGRRIELTDYEFRLLSLFLANPGRVLSRDEIAKEVAGRDWSPLDRTIDGHIARLRRKIEIDEDEPRMLKSVRNVGYVFAGQVLVTRDGPKPPIEGSGDGAPAPPEPR